ncbi:MAG: GcvT family protein [Deltaproteobacteria bacterium]|nr:GcvT family protein [Deltaproteobacteria bacterium]
MNDTPVPQHARAVVIGGGIIGCSVAYHLAELGWKDVVLLERDRLTCGTTWHAAGLMVTFGSTSQTSTEMRKYTRDLYVRLEKETGLSSGFRPVGFIQIATDADRLEEYRRVTAFNRHMGVDVQELSASEVKRLWPEARTDDVLAGFYVKEDGRVNPVDATMVVAKGARLRGVNILEGTPVTGILRKQGRVTGVRTPRGDITAEYVINCAGMWGRQLGELAGVSLPLQATEHYYLITEKIPGLDPSRPVIEDPGNYAYFREEVGGLMIGLFEPLAATWKLEGIPQDFSFGELPPDWDRMGPWVEAAMKRIPVSTEAGIRKFFCGPESFTPDLKPLVGESPELRNFFNAVGLNSIGILTGGGLGRVLAHWISTGRPDVDVTAFNVDRFHPYQANPAYRRDRTPEMLGMVYKCHYPGLVLQTARAAKRSPLHDRLVQAGAYFKDVCGWESPDWYAPPGHAPKIEKLSWGRQNWFPWWEAEHRAARDGVIVMDMSFMGKFLVQGRDAGKCLDFISANSVNSADGLITYTQWLNEDGGVEADLTVTRLAEDRFLVVTSDTTHRHVETWLRRRIPEDAHAFVTDVTGAYAQLNVQGPHSRALLQTLTRADLSNAAFPYRAAREIDLGYARVLLVRITYLGELGYELYIPAEQAVHVYDLVVEAGQALGLRHAGLKALGSLRMEKGYRDYGHDIDNTDSVLQVGLGFAVDLKKPGGFIGRDAVVREKERGAPTRRLVQVQVQDPAAMLFHAEIVSRNGREIGYVRSASWGFTLGGAVGLVMLEAGEPVNQAFLDAGTWEVNIAGRRYPASVSLRPLYDPDMKRVKA